LTCLETTQQIGKERLTIMCQAYLATLYRLAGNLPSCEEFSQRCLERAGKAGMPTYAGIAQANLAGRAWRAGEKGLAWDFAHNALEFWQGSVFPFQWTAHFLIIAVLLERGDLFISQGTHTRFILPQRRTAVS
jgi:hypothetical protein